MKESTLSPKPKVAILSAGLGHVKRGFETSAGVWHSELSKAEILQVKLFSGGKHPGSQDVWNLPRNGYLSRLLRKMGLLVDGCRLEQVTFAIGLLPGLLAFKPNVVWLQEITLANVLLVYKKWFSLKYKIIFCDGAPVGFEETKQFDYTIYLTEAAKRQAVAQGMNPQNAAVIPHVSYSPKVKIQKGAARQKLKVADVKYIILCVAAWNSHHKRIDSLLKEVALLNRKDVLLLLCGQVEQETAMLKQLAVDLKLNVDWRTLSQEELSLAYFASDLFVLPSISEALGTVLIEAAQHSLPVICHKHDAGIYLFNEKYNGLIDMTVEGNTALKIEEYLKSDSLENQGRFTNNLIQKRFNQDDLVSSLVNVIGKVVDSKLITNQAG